MQQYFNFKKIYCGIVGSRSRHSDADAKLIHDELVKLRPNYLVSGGCGKGADSFAEELSIFLDIPIIIYLANIVENMSYHDMVKAYYFRNRRIAEKSDILIALPNSIRKGGTENTIKYFCQLGKKSNLIIL